MSVENDHTFIAVIKIVAKLNEAQLDEVAQALTLSTLTFSKCQELTERLNEYNKQKDGEEIERYATKEVAEVYRILSYLQTNLGKAAQDITGLKKLLLELFKYNDIYIENDFSEVVYQKLHRIFSGGNEPLVQWHESAIIDNVLDFDCFLDVRPVISMDSDSDYSKDKINNLLSIVIFRIAVANEFDGVRSMVFQMTESDFEAFEAEVRSARRKLELVKANFNVRTISNELRS